MSFKIGKSKPAIEKVGQSIWLLILPFILPCLLAAFIASFLLADDILDTPNKKLAKAYNQHQGQIIQSAANEVLRMHQSMLSTAVTDNELRFAVLNQQWEQAEALIKQKYDDAKGVRVVPASIKRVDMTKPPFINNILLDNFQRIIDGETIQAELMKFKDDQSLILIESIRQDGAPIAFIVLAIDPNILAPILDGASDESGFWELVQTYGDSRLVATAKGDARARAGTAGTYPLQIKNWSIQYWSNIESQLATESSSQQLFFYLMATGFIGALSLLIVGFIINKKIESDARDLTRILVDNFGRRFNLSDTPMNLTIFNEIADLISSHSKEMPVQTANLKPKAEENDNQTLQKMVENEKSLVEPIQAPEEAIPKHVFRAYDIRGIVGGELSVDFATTLGLAIGSEAYERGQQTIVVARDGRNSGPELMNGLIDGLKSSGRDVIDIGEVPSPVMYFATHQLGTDAGVMITGSHNPAEYNGFKIILGGESLSGDDIQGLYQRMMRQDFMTGTGNSTTKDIKQEYIDRITGDVALAQPLKVVIDCGNGVAGGIAPELLQMLGCEVIGLFCEVDGSFPNHHPDPSKPENLEELINVVRKEKADIGIAYDGDGDRLGVVASDGTVIWPDRQMMLYSMDLLNRQPGADIIFDVKCSRHLAQVISSNGGRPIMYKSGHSLVKAKMKETGALLAGEQSGHIFFKERWYGFDDGIYASARLLEILANDFRKSSEIFESLPNSINTPEITVAVADDKKFALIEELTKSADFGDANIYDIDGLRVEFAHGWGLVRASNTTPNLTIRFEADDESAIKKIQDVFKQQLLKVDASLDLPF
jgi:phosphomannomutase / phosphoglucomutase